MSAIRTLAVAALIGSCGSPALAQAPAAADAALAVADYVKAEQPGGMGQHKRVAIASFVLHLVRDQGIERDAGSFGMFQGKSATYFVQVRGADPALLQSVADKLYDNFVASLKAAGVEVVPQAELDANPQYQEIRKASPQSPHDRVARERVGQGQAHGRERARHRQGPAAHAVRRGRQEVAPAHDVGPGFAADRGAGRRPGRQGPAGPADQRAHDGGDGRAEGQGLVQQLTVRQHGHEDGLLGVRRRPDRRASSTAAAS